MQTHAPMHPLSPRPLAAVAAVGHTYVNGPLEPETRLEVTRGMRPWYGPGGSVAAGGGWPGTIIRQFTFATRIRPPIPVNVVTGVPSKPDPPKKRRGRRWTL